MHRLLLFSTFLAIASIAHAQPAKPAPPAYTPTAANRCDYLASIHAGPEFSNGGPLQYELILKLDEARAACEQAVRDEPKTGRLWGKLARLRALGGDRAGELFRRAAKEGSPHASFNLGVMAANGLGVPRDDAAAKEFFYKAAQGHGDTLAMQLWAQRYEQSDAARERYLKKAAEELYPDLAPNPLRLSLGAAEPDGAALVAWYVGRARGGELWAQTYVGVLHEAGQWVPQDFATAADWYRAAGEGPHGDALSRGTRVGPSPESRFFLVLGLGPEFFGPASC